MLDTARSLQLLHAPHVGERGKALLTSIMVGVFWNLCRRRNRSTPLLRRFRLGWASFSWNVLIPTLVQM